MKDLLKDIDNLKASLDRLRPFSKEQLKNIEEYFEVAYTYDSNRIEGNTLTLQETALVINKGVTIGGKSMREHLEAINHYEAIGYVKDIIKSKITFTETILKDIHMMVLKVIDNENAGRYREIEVRIAGSKFIPPLYFKIPELMEEYFEFYENNKTNLHPVLLASDMHEKLVTIHPFTDGNGRTARLLMNLILLQNGYTIASIPGDVDKRIEYYNALEKVQTENDLTEFRILIAKEVKRGLDEYLKIVR